MRSAFFVFRPSFSCFHPERRASAASTATSHLFLAGAGFLLYTGGMGVTDNHDIIPIPDKSVLAEAYGSFERGFWTLLERLEQELKKRISPVLHPTYKARVKDFESYYRKLLRLFSSKTPPRTSGEETAFPVISDIIGIRIVCAFLQDLKVVERILTSTFNIIEIERKGADRTFCEFGYESTHVLVSVPEELKTGLPLPDGLIFEIQMRTILQDAWAEVEHELVYKSEFSPFDLPLKRKLASINASLSLADIIFQEIRDYQTKLNRELDRRRNSFYHQVDTEDDCAEGLASEGRDFTGLDENDLPYVQGTIDDMILDAIEAHNSGNLMRAISIYTRIISSKPTPAVLSVIYKHRGMAYFARSDYEAALSDFRESARINPQNFRAYYYEGIVLNILKRDEEAERAFTKSLSLNMYQPYLYLRRARSYYNMERYHDALEDLDRACSLGLDKPEEKILRMRIAEKMDVV